MKVLILGGGASGLMAALSAAQDERNTVTVLERQSRVGRKLLATGNGRCNLTNLDLSPVHYHGQDAGFARAALSRFDGNTTLDFFHALGLLTAAEPSGRVYPLSDQSNSVVDVLRFAAAQAGVLEDAQYGADILVTYRIPAGADEALRTALREASSGTIAPQLLEEIFCAG